MPDPTRKPIHIDRIDNVAVFEAGHVRAGVPVAAMDDHHMRVVMQDMRAFVYSVFVSGFEAGRADHA